MKRTMLIVLAIVFLLALSAQAQTVSREVLLQSKIFAGQEELKHLKALQVQIGERVKVIEYEAHLSKIELTEIHKQAANELRLKKKAEEIEATKKKK